MKTPNAAPPVNASAAEGEKKRINGELWQVCAGPLVNLPPAGTHVVYFPQGHSEQVAASLKKDVDAQIPNYPNLPSKLLCVLHNVTLHADPETDEVYAQMTLQPVPSFDKEALLTSDLSMKVNKPQTEFFCKTLTASDTSTHGGFSVPRRAAEKIFPPLDFSMQPPAQVLVARDLHDNVCTFRHIFRGQPKRHLLTTGWSLFVSGKRLITGDAVLFIRDDKQHLLLGIRRANRRPNNLQTSVLSTDSMHIGILAAAAHAASNNSPFTVFYNPRSSPSEFIIPLAKYYKAVCSNQISLGMRFRMMFETEESGTRRYMGTITGIGDLDPVRWKNSQWRNLQVGWDESTSGERRNRVSIWEIEPVTAPFYICPTTPFFRPKHPRQPGMPDDDDFSDLDSLFRRSTMPWLGDEFAFKDPQSLPALSLAQWMNMNQNPARPNSVQPNYVNPLPNPLLQTDVSRQLGMPSTQIPHQNNLQQQRDQIPKLPSSTFSHLGSIVQPQRNLAGPMGQAQAQTLQSQTQNVLNHQLQRNLSQNFTQQQNLSPIQDVSDNQIQLQILQKLHHQQQSRLVQAHDQQKQLLETSSIPPQSHVGNNSQTLRFAQPPQHPQSGIQSEVSGHLGSTNLNPITNQLSAGGGAHSAVTNDVPSCSTSPSRNNCPSAAQPVMNGQNRHCMIMGDEMAHSSVTLLNSSGLEHKDLQKKYDVKPSLNVSKNQSQGFFTSPTFINAAGNQIDYLDSSSSVTSVLSQNDSQIPPNNSVTFNSQFLARSNASFTAEIDTQLAMPMMPEQLISKDMVGPGKDFSSNLSSGGAIISAYDNPKEAQCELSSSMVSHSFGVPEMAFNSTINDDGFVNRGAWAPPQIPRMRTYTKVYKRGAVGRSIDITRYSGYDELKQDLARRFGIEGQLEERQRIGWKLVYVDHENDVLLVGDDPWEEFVSCVRCIKILSPQEVQHMSLDGEFGNSVLPNQACSSSDNGVS